MFETFIQLQSLFLALAFIANLGLSLFVYLKNRKEEINRSFSAMLLGIAFWIASLFVFLLIKDLRWLLLVRRLTPVGSSVLAGYFLYFAILFPKRHKPLDLKYRCLILWPGYIFAVFSVTTPWMIKGFKVIDQSFPFLSVPSFGFLYYFYSVYFVLYFLIAFSLLFWKYFKSQGREKLQIFYILFGTGIAGGIGLIFSLLLPLYGFIQLFTFGPVFTLIFSVFITYAIVRHRLLQIDDFLTRGLYVFWILAVVVGTVYCLTVGRITFLPTFYLVLVQIGLGFLVYLRNWRSEINFSFAFFVITLALWNYFAYLVTQRVEPGLMLADKLILLLAALLLSFFLYFTYVFPKGRLLNTFRRFLIFLFPLLVLIFNYFNLVIEGVVVKDGIFTPVFGPAYIFYIIFAAVYVILGLYNLINSYRFAVGVERLQIRYVFLGLFLASGAIATTNLILPWFGEARLASLGPFFSIFFIGFTAYAIVKHRLMSIEVVIQRSTVYALSTILIMTIYILTVVVSEIYLRKVVGYTSLIITALAALVIAVAYQPVVKFFQNLTDRLFFRGRYDYQKTLRKISHEITSVIKLEELAKLVVSSFVDTMKIVEMSFLLLEKEKEHFRSIPISLPHYKRIEIDVKSPIVSFLMSTKDILVKDEIEDEISRQEALGKEGEERRKGLEEVRDEMERLGISIWVPVVSKGELIGIIALGEKLSGDIYTTEDLALLATLSNQIAVALDNARLYDEVVTMKDYSEEILQSMTNGVLTTDTSGKIVTFNLMAEKITGRKASEVLGKSCEEIWGKRGAITIAIENTLKDRCYVNFESSVVSPERGLVPVSFSSTLLRDLHGKKMGALLSIQDLSEVKALEDKVRRADKLSALATMAAGMAHEIKNPLSSMKVFSQLLPKRFEDPEFRKKLEEILPREIDRIDRIVESLLGFARATTPTFEKVKIEEIIEENLKYYEQLAKNAGVTIKKNYTELPEIEVDRSQISQVFSNLILNAIQAMPEGGELSVVTLPGKKVDDTVQSIKVKISDTGHGIPEEMKKKLFDPFFTTKYGGTGLGLTIAHSIVDGHKGFIDVESQVGKGTTFTITLPVSQGLV